MSFLQAEEASVSVSFTEWGAFLWKFLEWRIGSQSGVLISLAVAFVVAFLFVTIAYRLYRKRRWRRTFGILFSGKVWRSKSAGLDYKYAVLNIVAFPIILTFAIVSYHWISVGTLAGLNSFFGMREATQLPEWLVGAVILFVAFLAYELAYWTDHYLAHKWMFLWEFHKVHHSAEVLTPLTNLRVHPVDSIVFYNIKALTIGGTYGIVSYLMGREAVPMGENLILIVYFMIYGHLQHSQLWIPFTGWWGRVFLSPAHHQIHHSSASEHFDKNFGGSLSLFDWLFGTLYMPSKKRQKLIFGVNAEKNAQAHNLDYSLINPFTRAGKRLRRRFRRKNPARQGQRADAIICKQPAKTE